MKTRLTMMLCMAVAVAGLSCQKFGEQDRFGDKLNDIKLGALFQPCAECYEDSFCTVTLDNDINNYTRTLHPDTVYLISGVSVVRNGGKLEIPAGTRLLGDTDPLNKGYLVVEATGTIEATGTATCPIVFTSAEDPGDRNPGDWGGVFILGKADNNGTGSVISFTIGGTNFTAGDVLSTGANDNDNSGIFRYVQIHYAGYQPGGDTDPGALLFGAVGKGTETHHIQITNSANDGFTLRGGVTKLEYLFNYDVQNRDFVITNGNRSEMQFVASLRRNAAPALNSGYGLEISSDKGIVVTSTPLTHPVISNITLLGPSYCGGSLTNYADAVIFRNNGSGSIYNSVFTNYQRGLFLDGEDVISNTASGPNELQFSYNSFHGFSSGNEYDYLPNISWAVDGGCGSGLSPTMTQWIDGTTAAVCGEDGNEIPVADFDMDVSVCNNYCQAFPSFVLDPITDMDFPNFDWDSENNFDHSPEYRGAFDFTGSWVDACWMNLCPQLTAYCP